MSGKENIIASILGDAEQEKARIIKEAQDKALLQEQEDQKYITALNDETEKKAEAEGKLQVERSIAVANMDVKKLLLQTKQDKIKQVFDQALQAILSLPEENYNAFLISLLQKYAEEGDKVVFAKSDVNRVKQTESYVKAMGFTYSFDGNFVGGVLLEGKNSDKNLTVEMLLKQFKEENQSAIANILAGE